MSFSHDNGFKRLFKCEKYILHHVFIQVGYFLWKVLQAEMSLEEEQVLQIANAVSATIGQQFAANFNKFHEEMVVTQAASSQQVMEKLNHKTHTFKKKSCQTQFALTTRVDDHVQAAKKQLDK